MYFLFHCFFIGDACPSLMLPAPHSPTCFSLVQPAPACPSALPASPSCSQPLPAPHGPTCFSLVQPAPACLSWPHLLFPRATCPCLPLTAPPASPSCIRPLPAPHGPTFFFPRTFTPTQGGASGPPPARLLLPQLPDGRGDAARHTPGRTQGKAVAPRLQQHLWLHPG